MVKSARAKRMEKHHKRNKGAGVLNLVSLMDIFTILVFFLLVNSSDVQTLPNAKDMKLPESIAEKKPEETVTILVGRIDILVQGTPVAKIADVMAIKGNDIPALREALLSQNDRVLRREAKDDIAGREVTIMGDKDIPYRLSPVKEDHGDLYEFGLRTDFAGRAAEEFRQTGRSSGVALGRIVRDQESRNWTYRFIENMSCPGRRARIRRRSSSVCWASSS
jgi:biopolymer transport protein ExbD